MADPSGAPPQPGPDDISTAILRPKKSRVFFFYAASLSRLTCTHVYRPNRLIVDEATADDNSGKVALLYASLTY